MTSAFAADVTATGLARVLRFNKWQLVVVASLLCICVPLTTSAATLPAGFTETIITGLSNPTAMAFAPDGRLFVCQQTGELRVIKNGALLPASFMTLTVDSFFERGLLGIAFDPNFATNNFLYVYYTATTPTTHNRISRFTANGDVVVPDSEFIILDLPTLGAGNHNGGAIHFGPDGKLYVAVGENAVSANSQTFANILGKMLRINPNPADLIPTDNPYFNDPTVTGINKAIWSLGLRNPFTFGFQPGTGRMFINDVGQNAWEEINDGIAHSNYGWPNCEGNVCGSTPVDYRAPLYVYNHTTGTPTGCAIVGAAFYNPTTVQFPATYVGKYFFADLCSGFIRYVDPGSGAAIPSSTAFATGIISPVDLQVSSDGSLWYLFRGGSVGVGRIQFPAGQIPPTITQHPQSLSRLAGESATFNCNASGATPINFQWQRNNADIPGATGTSYTIGSVTLADNNVQFRCIATNAFASAPSNNATLTVTANPFSPGSVLISEFRLDGPNGVSDEFLELYNNTDASITVQSTDGSSGWAVGYGILCQPCPPNGQIMDTYFVIPNGTVIPPRGHFLFTNTHVDNGNYVGYSLKDYGGLDQALGDAVFTGSGLGLGLVDNFWQGYALFTTSNQANWTLAARLDAVEGFLNVNPLFDSGTGINLRADYFNATAQYSWARRLHSGLPQDTDNSAVDWVVISHAGPFMTGDDTLQIVPAILGAPGPENLTSPVQRNAQVKASLIEPQQPSSSAPNRLRDTTAGVCGGGSPCAFGTLEIRRRFRNNTGAAITRLRFRVVDITTLNTPNPGGAQADLRLITTGDLALSTSLGNLTVRGTLIEVPPNLAVNGGGLHASAITTLPGLLQPGATVDVRFLLGVQAGGSFRFLVNVEALPGPAGLQVRKTKSGKESAVRNQQ